MHRRTRRIKPGLLILAGAILVMAAGPPPARSASSPPPADAAAARLKPAQLAPPGPPPSSDARPPSPGASSPGAFALEPFALLNSVVRIEAKAAQGADTARLLGAQRSGTGVLLDKTTVLTIGYLLLEVEELELVTPSGKRIPGNVVGYDAVSGFGLVQSVLPLDGHPLELGDSDNVKEMERVLTLGHGEGLPTELLVVSRKPFAGSWEYMLDSGIFTYPPVNNWSGAALINAEGKLVGIGSLLVNDAAADRRGVPGNLYVPTNLLKPILDDLKTIGRRAGPPQPWLGIATEVVQGNLIVSRVTPGGPADQAGLAAGDVIVSVAGERVPNQAEFYRHIWKLGPAGVTVPLRVLKSGDVRDVPVKTVDRMSTLRKPQGV